MARKLVGFHPEDLRAIEQLADDKSSTLQELMDEAVRDLLKKHGLPTNLRDALKQSAKSAPDKQPSDKQSKKKSIPDTPPDRNTQSSGRERTKNNRSRR